MYATLNIKLIFVGFVENNNHYKLPEYQTWESEGNLPDIELYPDDLSKYIQSCALLN